MTVGLKRKSNTGLSSQLVRIIMNRIKTGEYAQGSRLSSVRNLSDEFKVSNNTVMEAIKALEAKNCVHRVPARGIFISDNARKNLDVVNIVFAFPEESLSLDILGYEDTWGIASEIFRGLLAGSLEHNAKINYIYCNEKESLNQQLHQFERVGQIDGVVFVSDQLEELKRHFISLNTPVVTVAGSEKVSGCLHLVNDVRKNMEILAQHLYDSGYRSLGLLRKSEDSERNQIKHDLLLSAAVRAGIVFKPEWEIQIEDRHIANAYHFLRDKINFSSNDMPDAFFTNSCTIGAAFIRLVQEHQMQTGRDIGICGYASIHGYRNLQPSMTYLALPHYEMGKKAVKAICEKNSGTFSGEEIKVSGKLITGESTTGFVKQ